ncbi:site-2 protease family protein [Planctomyces sp. SH-PL62]|uniref:site-2 protease family protein n=1 Tax=Planctomyces sp. SH-PL62 TaxID=1636152 RepID=UPI00078B4A08|nr:site-2 protease family protein [Planctomyces sp. SH-PL62]AMV39629.1 Putative zinc metalloprotease Rip3 [Planctomyces sp. SH-PL62]
MNMSWKLGRIAGIDVFLHSTFFLILFLPAAATHLPLLLAMFGCVLLHEFGHALTARRFGIGTADITIYPIGGVARLTRMPRAPGAELLIALAGPAVNIAIAAGLYLSLGVMSSLGMGRFFADLLVMNLVLAGFNLIPAFPMDGGRVLRALLGGWLGRGRATVFAASVGRALAVGFGVYSLLNLAFFQVALAVFIYMAARAEEIGVLADERRRAGETEEGLDWSTPPGYRWIQTGRGVWRLAPITVSSQSRATWRDPRWR